MSASTAAPGQPTHSDVPGAADPTPDPGDPVTGRPTRPWLRIVAVLGPVVALLVATLVPALLLSLLPEPAADTPGGVLAAIVVGQSVLVCAAVIGLTAALLRLHGLRLRDAGVRWTRASLPSLAIGVGLGAVVVLAVGLLLTRLGLLRAGETWDLPWYALIIAGLAQAFVLQGFPEELLFRGYQMTALRLRPVAALFVSAAVFGVLHLISSGGQESTLERVLYLAMPFGFAVAGGALMIVTDSLWAAVGVHAGVHVGFLAGLFLGIGNGPWFWLTCGAIWTLVGVGLLVVAQRQGRLAAIWSGPRR